MLLGGEGEELPNRRKLARSGGCAEPLPPPFGKEGAKVRRCKRQQCGRADQLAPIAAQELDQTMGGRDIGADGMRGAPAVVLEMAMPARRDFARRMVG